MAVGATASPRQATERLWTIDFVLNLLTAHFMFACMSALLTILPPYIFFRGGQEWHLGIIIGSFGIVGIFFRPMAGRWVYALGAKRIAVAGTAMVALGALLHIVALSFWWLIPIRMLQAVGISLGPVATSTITANLAPATRRAEAMSYMGNAIQVSFFYAPVLASLIQTHGGFHNAFLFSAFLGTIGTLAALRISTSRIAPQYTTPTTQGQNKIPLISKAALFPTLVFLTYTFTRAPMSTFLPILAEEQKLGNPGLFYTVFAATSMAAMMVSGPVADRFGRATVIIPGLLFTAAAMFVVNASFFQMMFLGGGVLAGLGFGFVQPGLQSLTVDRVPQRERSAGIATLQMAWDFGGFGGAFIIGPIGAAIGAANTFGITGITALIGVAGFIVGNSKTPSTQPIAQSPEPSKAD